MTYPRFAIDQDPLSVQCLAPPSTLERFEGVDFSSSGKILGIATADTNAVLLFRQTDDGRFEDAPYARIDGPASRLNYPHDVAFAMCGETELLAVAQRAGAIVIYARSQESKTYGPAPVYEIMGPKSQLEFSDGVAFVPPHDQYLAVCNLTLATISFYRRLSVSPICFEVVPEFQLRHPSVVRPDGLAFSRCGRWLATANHGNNSVSVFQRRNKILAGGKLRYGPEPVTVIEDPEMRYPHSVAFAPETNHLIVHQCGSQLF